MKSGDRATLQDESRAFSKGKALVGKIWRKKANNTERYIAESLRLNVRSGKPEKVNNEIEPNPFISSYLEDAT